MRSKKIKRSVGQRIVFSIAICIFAIHSFTLIFSWAWGISSSLKTQEEFSLNSPLALPESWLFSNYIDAFKVLKVRNWSFLGLIFNSAWFSIGTPLIQASTAIWVSYLYIKVPNKVSNFFHGWTLFWMMVTISGTGAALYKLYYAMGILNSPLFLLGKYGCLPFQYLVSCAAWRGVANDYSEAAKIDGASEWGIFLRIMCPQVSGVWLSLFLLQFIECWNDATTPMMYFPDWPTVANGLLEYEQQMIRQVNMPIYFAGLLLSSIPVLLLFILFQDVIMEKVHIGGLKG